MGANPYDLAYTYDAGGNRLTKTDAYHDKLTTYYYDTDPVNRPTWIEAPVEFGGHTLYLRGRLLTEKRVGANRYDLAYTYDAGRNRLTKTDAYHDKLTTYYYDTDPVNRPTWIEAPGSKANRLLGYEEIETVFGNLIVRVKYDYYMEGHGAGNVAQIRHLYYAGQTNDGTTTVTQYVAKATMFEYNKMGELWLTSWREWAEFHSVVNASGALTVLPIDVANVTTKDVVEFRGAGRKRWMYRHRETTPWTHPPLYDSAVWTDYEGVEPLGDYTVTVTDQNPIVATQTASQFYDLGFAQADEAGQVMYEHSDQVGSTRAMSDSAGTVQKQLVYTAFGEPTFESGTFETRYEYAGKHGYEGFGSFSANFSFPYMHVGARWYDPTCG